MITGRRYLLLHLSLGGTAFGKGHTEKKLSGKISWNLILLQALAIICKIFRENRLERTLDRRPAIKLADFLFFMAEVQEQNT